METMRESWTDQRLDEFAADTGRRFDGVDKRLDKVDGRLGRVEGRLGGVEGRLGGVEGRLDRIDTDIRELRSQTAAFQRLLIQLSCGALVTLAAGFAGVIAQL